MRMDPVTKKKHEAARTPSVQKTQTGRMRAAVEQAVAVAPSFLRGEIDADRMAKTMVQAVRSYFEEEQSADRHRTPLNEEGQSLQGALNELMACGSGYLAGQCDAACVARTMTQMVQEFPAN